MLKLKIPQLKTLLRIIKITNLRGPKKYLYCPKCLGNVSMSHVFATPHILSQKDLDLLKQAKINTQIVLGL